MKKFIFLLLAVCPWLTVAQEYRVVSIPIGYHYAFNDGHADGSGTCSSCWTYANRIPGLLHTNTLEKIPADYRTDQAGLPLSFYEKRDKIVNTVWGQNNYCYNAQYKSRDAFTSRQVGYCDARVSREDVLLQPGMTLTLGNEGSQNLDDHEYTGPLSAVKVWMLPNVVHFERSVGYCEDLFTQQGIPVDGGYWEYLIDEDLVWRPLDGRFADRYPLNISLETLDESTTANLRQTRFLKLRFVLNATGGGEYGGFRSSITSSATEVPGTGTAILGPYNFTVYRCAPELVTSPLVHNVRCNGGSSGSFELHFDRDLEEQYSEKMLVMLYKYLGQEYVFLESRVLSAGDLIGRMWSWGASLEAGMYKVRWMTKEGGDSPESIPDAYRESEPFAIGEPDLLQLSAAGIDILCKGGNNGEIRLYTRGGVPPYRYSIDGESWSAQPQFTGLGPGGYTPMVRDSNDCEVSTEVVIKEPASGVEAVVLRASDPTAYGETDGLLNMLVSGGTPPYSYVWERDGEVISSDEDLRDIGAGSYSFKATDANGCVTDVQTFEMVQPDPLGLLFIADSDSLSCAEATITLRVQGTGSASAWDNSYTYQWIDGTEGPIRIDAGAGDHEVTVYDKYGNGHTETFVLRAPEPIAATVTKGDVLCKGSDNGYIRLEVTGGTPPYSVQWSRIGDSSFSENGMAIEGIPAGDYSYRIVDANGCAPQQDPALIRITEPEEAITLIEVVRQEITAYDAANGGLEVTISGGTPPYRYEWVGPGGFMADTPAIRALEEGVYTLMVADQNAGPDLRTGCFLIEDFELLAPEPLTASAAQLAPVTCNGSRDAIVQGTVSGGVMPYVLEWFRIGNEGGEEAVGSGAFLEDIGPGDYVLRVTDHYGSTAASEVIRVTDPPVLKIVSAEVENTRCPGTAQGAVSVEVSGGVPPYRILWSNGASGMVGTGLEEGDHIVYITDANGCSLSAAYTIRAESSLNMEAVVINRPSSINTPDGVVRLQISGGVPPFEVFDNGRLLVTEISSLIDIEGQAPGVHRYEVRDAEGCMVVQELKLSPAEWVQFMIDPPSCPERCDGSVALVISEALGAADVLWEDGDTSGRRIGLCSGRYGLTISSEETGSQTYWVEIPEAEGPDPGIPEIITLCSGSQTVVSAGTYQEEFQYEWWQDDLLIADAPEITLMNAGSFELKVIGESCTWSFPFDVVFSSEVQVPEFVMSTDVFTGEEVLAIDVTVPLPEQVEWYLPDEAVVTGSSSDAISFYFKTPGEYEVGMRVSKGACQSTVVKTIRVLDPAFGGDPTLAVSDLWVSEPKLYPNPVASYFNLEVELQKAGSLSVKVYSLANNKMVSSVTDAGKRSYRKQIEVSGAPPGMYAVLIETDLGSRVYKVVKS